MTNKLIVYMIDGVAAEHYQSDRKRFPYFAALEARGFRVENLHAEALGTSLPGRTTNLFLNVYSKQLPAQAIDLSLG
ncbi:MAG TPA: hypothetical protein P5121_37905 [Caldilineaceae bacterium]|nr:hypothetical protein [Caldilineaceae bacterium]